MHDNPEPTEQEQDATPEGVTEEESMAAPAFEDPPDVADIIEEG